RGAEEPGARGADLEHVGRRRYRGGRCHRRAADVEPLPLGVVAARGRVRPRYTGARPLMIKIEKLDVRYPTDERLVHAVRGISIDVEKGEFYTLLGPSGCGKTTTLRSLAGLEKPDGGEIAIDGETVYSDPPGLTVPPYKRDIGMVFQSYAIWPHLN